ncbi:MAG: hypothetical protein KJ792_10095 [Actinobacteria bacterium]|nr:hypothetical protein [Actinomycetota bacterium]MCG2801341.1 hypothetical protein [Cellulomonas sp.]
MPERRVPTQDPHVVDGELRHVDQQELFERGGTRERAQVAQVPAALDDDRAQRRGPGEVGQLMKVAELPQVQALQTG